MKQQVIITLNDLRSKGWDTCQFTVCSLENTIEFKISDVLNEADVQSLIDQGYKVKIK